MTRFVIGLLLGLLLGIAGTSAFLITAGGGDYLIVTSPKVRDLEAKLDAANNDLKNANQEREWQRKRLDEFSELTTKLESRFSALSARFEALAGQAQHEPGETAPLPTPSPSLAEASPPPSRAAAHERPARAGAATPRPDAEATP